MDCGAGAAGVVGPRVGEDGDEGAEDDVGSMTEPGAIGEAAAGAAKAAIDGEETAAGEGVARGRLASGAWSVESRRPRVGRDERKRAGRVVWEEWGTAAVRAEVAEGPAEASDGCVDFLLAGREEGRID